MARIATNHAIDYKRKKARENEELSLCKETEENIKSSHNIADLFSLTKEQLLLIAQKLRELPENYRDVVLAHYLEEKSYQEIALQEKIEVKTVEMKLYRARKWIKKHWKEEEFL
ncbi:RNA polymerase sigma factor SigW [Bacillus anthracis]|nr:RNA polymerase sigma factor SigW [Bacillus anthracis]